MHISPCDFSFGFPMFDPAEGRCQAVRSTVTAIREASPVTFSGMRIVTITGYADVQVEDE